MADKHPKDDDKNKPLSKDEIAQRIGELPSKSNNKLKGTDLSKLLAMLSLVNSAPSEENVCSQFFYPTSCFFLFYI